MCFSHCLAPKFKAFFDQWRGCIAEKSSYSQISRMFGFSSFSYLTYLKIRLQAFHWLASTIHERVVDPGVFTKRIILLGIAGCKMVITDSELLALLVIKRALWGTSATMLSPVYTSNFYVATVYGNFYLPV